MANDFETILDTQATLAHIQKLGNINPKSWKDMTDKGVFRECYSYGDYLARVITYYRESNEAKLLKEQNRATELEAKPRFKSSDERQRLEEITIAEKIQKIKLDKARETDVWIKNAANRGLLIDKSELEQLMFPSLTTMYNILQHTAIQTPELMPTIDKCLTVLFNIGEKLEKIALGDGQTYVDTMLNSDVNIRELIDNFGD